MKRHLCVLVFGLLHALHGAEINSDNVASEAKDIIFRDGTFNPFSYKREATKITNTDNPSFNYLKPSTSLTSTPSSSGGFKPSSPPKVSPFKYIQSNQLQQSGPFVSYFQSTQPAAEIAAQYLQVVPITQYQLQTPTQLQYVASPTVAQYSLVNFQNPGVQYTSGNAGSDVSRSNAVAASSQYLTSTQQTSSLGTAPSASQASLSTSLPVKQIPLQQQPSQVFYSAQQQQQQQQQPYLTFYQLQPQVASNFLYQQPNANYYLSQYPQQYFNFYPANRFGLYSPVHGTQLYVTPVAQAQTAQETTSANGVKSSSEQKASSPSQQITSSTSTTFGSKV